MKPISFLVAFALSASVSASAGQPLHDAARTGSVSEVEALLEKGSAVDEEYQGSTALGIAAYRGHTEVVKSLLDRGASVDSLSSTQPGQPRITALAMAAMGQHTGVAQLLVARGADVQKAKEGLDIPVQGKGNGNGLFGALSVAMEATNKAYGGKVFLDGLQKDQVKAEAVEAVEAVKAAAAAPAPASQPAANALPTLSPKFLNIASVHDYAVIIGIENYLDLRPATYAERDATAAKNFIRAMGVPERNIVLLTGQRATKSGLEKTIEDWLPNNVSPKSRVYIYYSGHGAPDPKTGGAYLLPSDGDPQYLARTGYPLKQLYFQLGQLKAKSVFVALDSCFSGAGGRSVLAKGTRPLVGKVDVTVQTGGSVSVLTASAADQVSGSDDKTGYGLFTYAFLQGLNGAAKDAQGRVTLNSLYSYLKPKVESDARQENREQTPQLQSGGADLVLRSK